MGTRQQRVADGGVAAGRAARSAGARGVAPRVLLVSSSGGVLTDLLGMRAFWERLDRRWVAVSAADTRELLAAESVDWADDVTPSHPGQMAGAILPQDVTCAGARSIWSCRREPRSPCRTSWLLVAWV